MHKKGQAITGKEKEQVIALAQTKLMLKEIADIVGISPRSVARILKEKGISRSSMKSPKGGGIVSVVRTATPETALGLLQMARKKEHSDYLREQLHYLAAHIRIPPPESIFLWPWQTELSYPVNELVASSSDGVIQRQSIYIYLKMIDGQIHVSPDIERTEDWKFLWAHLMAEKSPDIMEDYAQWVSSLGRFFTMCYKVLVKIVSEIDRRINETMHESPSWQGVKLVSNWGERGIHRWFYEDISSLALSQRAWNKEEFNTKTIEGQPDLVSLWREGRALSTGTMAEVDAYRNVGKTIVDEAAGWIETRSLLETYQQCQAKGESLLSKLNVIEKRGDFQGVCDVCQPWCTLSD